MTNLKQALMELGNRLVTKHGFLPATNPRDEQDGPSTWPVRRFTEWLNTCKEARQVLAEMGFEWPVRHFPMTPIPAISDALSRKGFNSTSFTEAFLRGRPIPVLTITKRHGYVQWYIQNHFWHYDDFDGEKDHRETQNTLADENTSEEAVVALIERTFAERNWQR